MEVVKKSQKQLNKAVLALKKGKVIICPTDTVYGFLADGSNKKAVEKIFKIKKRAKSKPLPVFIADFKIAKELAIINIRQEKILRRYWPGKYTFVLNRKPGAKLFGVDQNTIALRIPKYNFLNDLLKKINIPLVQTSVNISTKPALIRIEDIVKEFENQKNKPDLIISSGRLPNTKASTIIDLSKYKIKILRK